MCYRSLQKLIRNLKVSIFWKIEQKFENLSVKVIMVKSVYYIFFDRIADFAKNNFVLKLM